MPQIRRPHNRSRNTLLTEHPRSSHLRHAHALLLRDLLDTIDDVVRRALLVPPDEPVCVAAEGLGGERAGEQAAGYGGPGDAAYTE